MLINLRGANTDFTRRPVCRTLNEGGGKAGYWRREVGGGGGGGQSLQYMYCMHNKGEESR